MKDVIDDAVYTIEVVDVIGRLNYQKRLLEDARRNVRVLVEETEAAADDEMTENGSND